MAAVSVAVASEFSDEAAVQELIEWPRRYYLVPQDLAPFLEALVRGQNCRGSFITPIHELEEQHRSALADRKVADEVDRVATEYFSSLSSKSSTNGR